MYRFVLPSIPHFYFGFRLLWIHAPGLPVAPHSYFHFFRLLYLLTSNTESCDEDDDVGVGVVEELVDKPGTTNGT